MLQKNQKTRRDELRLLVANVYRTVAEKLWPGMLSRKPVFRLHYLKFIDEASQQLISSQSDYFPDLLKLRFALASVLRALAPSFVESKSERFDTKTRKKLFELLRSWCDDGLNLLGQESNSEYRRDIERYKAIQHNRSRESISFDKEIVEKMEALQWISMNAMVSLLYGPCFDDHARKMTGRVITWINSLFLEYTPKQTFGWSSADSKIPCSKYTGQVRVLLAKTALKNLLQTNLELFPAYIDQVISCIFFTKLNYKL